MITAPRLIIIIHYKYQLYKMTHMKMDETGEGKRWDYTENKERKPRVMAKGGKHKIVKKTLDRSQKQNSRVKIENLTSRSESKADVKIMKIVS